MKKIQYVSILILLATTFSSCAVVGGIFKAGMGFGIFLVLAIAVFIVWLVSRNRR